MQSVPTPPIVKPRRIRRAARVVLPSLAAAAVTAVGFAAFTDEATNTGNQATAASVTITQDVPAGSPMFDLADWQPHEDDTVARCITVENEGSVALPLSLRLDGAPTGALGDFIDMKIERGTRAADAAGTGCASFQPDAADPVIYDAELSAFGDAPGEGVSDRGGTLAVDGKRAYRITWHLQDDEQAEGQSVSGVDFLWESTSQG